jgi:hypothetical protein
LYSTFQTALHLLGKGRKNAKLTDVDVLGSGTM